METELILRWLFIAIIVGAGLTIGVACAIGATQILGSVVEFLMKPITKKYKLAEYEFGKVYNPYQTIKLNGKKYIVLESDEKILYLRTDYGDKDRYIVITHYSNDDLEREKLSKYDDEKVRQGIREHCTAIANQQK